MNLVLEMALTDTNSSKSHIVPPLAVIKPILHDELANFGQKTLIGQDRQRWYNGCFCCSKKKSKKLQLNQTLAINR